ncbi:probable arabinose 5-phosphate isomerase [Physcomitrium patens]|uniref:probable arabinose 5-phosphate isomerase n=1 Tax=Physcomitrium patens TaxID=3218 RepID=UPI000D1669B1|nr:probable arabinose 5-phosphate isomerase [Physcomitrium patens]|eukprot:XP_024363838.1 probable arabinose 5-phosphate isomerase [Physcomitrella patens]
MEMIILPLSEVILEWDLSQVSQDARLLACSVDRGVPEQARINVITFLQSWNYLGARQEFPDLVQAFTQLCTDTKGVIFFSGVGKRGFVAQKCAQTLVSTSALAVFLSPTNALHGDIGLVGPNDVLVLFSKSGATEELNILIPCAIARSAYFVDISLLKHSNFRKMCDMHVYLPLERELCPFYLAPVTSTAIQMLFCDTVSIALMKTKNLAREQYAWLYETVSQ